MNSSDKKERMKKKKKTYCREKMNRSEKVGNIERRKVMKNLAADER